MISYVKGKLYARATISTEKNRSVSWTTAQRTQGPRISARIQHGFIFAVWAEEVTIQPIMLNNNYQYFGRTFHFAYSPRFLISHAHRYPFFYHFSILIMNDISFILFFVVALSFTTNNVAPSSADKHKTHISSIHFDVSTQLIAPNNLVILSHRRSTTVFLETYTGRNCKNP